MEKIDVLGKLISFNPNTNIISIQYGFVTPELIGHIENLLVHPGLTKHSFSSVKPFRSKTYKQQCQMWVDIEKVLKKQKIEINKESKSALYDWVKTHIFPAKMVMLGHNEHGEPIYQPTPPDMKDLSIEQMAESIQIFRNYYSYLKIDWEKK